MRKSSGTVAVAAQSKKTQANVPICPNDVAHSQFQLFDYGLTDTNDCPAHVSR